MDDLPMVKAKASWMMPTHQITHGTQVISERFGDCKGVVEAVALASMFFFAEPNGFVFNMSTWTNQNKSTAVVFKNAWLTWRRRILLHLHLHGIEVNMAKERLMTWRAVDHTWKAQMCCFCGWGECLQGRAGSYNLKWCRWFLLLV